MFFLTSVLNSEYLLNILLRANLLLFLGADNVSLSDIDVANNNSANDVSALDNDMLLINGTFYYDSSDNFENYLSELGVGYFLRKLALLAFPIITISRNCATEPVILHNDTDCVWNIKTDAGLRTHNIQFQLDTWTQDTTMDGRRIMTMFTRPTVDTLVELQMSDKVNTTLVRQFYNDRMEVTMRVNNVVATSLFKRNSV